MIPPQSANRLRFPQEIAISDRKIINVALPFSIAFQKRLIKQIAAKMPHVVVDVQVSPEPPLLSSLITVDREHYLPETVTVCVGEFVFSSDPTANGRVVVFVCLRSEACGLLMWLFAKINRRESLAAVPAMKDHRSQWSEISSDEKSVLMMSAGADYIRGQAIAAALSGGQGR